MEELVAPDATLTDVTVAPPELSEKTQVLPELVRENEMEEEELAVSMTSLKADEDHTPLTSVPPSTPPVTEGWEFCKAKLLTDVNWTPLSFAPVTVKPIAALEPVHLA
jgi:hypothetical protein